MSTTANEDKFSALVAAYLADSSCSPDELEQFLSCRYKLNVHVPMADEELEERLEHMKNIQRLLDNNQIDAGDAEMTRIAASFCLLLPLAKLRGLRDDIKNDLVDLKTTFQNLLQTVTLYRTCKLLKTSDEKVKENRSLDGSVSKELEPTKVLEEQGEPSTPQTKGMNKRRADSVSESIHSGGNNKKIASSGPTSERLLAAKADARSLPSNESKAASLGESTGSKWRNDGQKRECRKRDNEKCIFTHCTIVEVCHILGWALQSTEPKKDRVRKSIEELFAYFGDKSRLEELLCQSISSDKSWNMLTLSRPLHSLWGDGQIALECMGIVPTLDERGRIVQSDPATITLRFFWLNVKKGWRANDKFKLNYDTLSEMSRDRFLPKALPGNRIFRDKDSRCVVSGNEVDITLSLHDAVKMQAVIDAHWHSLNIWAMSGAATDFALAKPGDFEPEYCGDPLKEGVLPAVEHKMDIDDWLQGLP